MAVGLFFVFLKLGRKVRFLFVLLRPGTSWMTRETYAVVLFYPGVIASLAWSHPAFYALTGLAAVAFLISQAQILFAAKGIPAWRAPQVPWMLMATGLLEGVGLVAIVSSALKDAMISSAAMGVAGFVLAVVNVAVFAAYRRNAKSNGIGPLSRKDIEGVAPVVLLAGYGLPALCFAFAPLAAKAALIGGMMAVAGGFFWKFTLVTRICHQQGFALPKVPQRGSGAKAAPARTEYKAA